MRIPEVKRTVEFERIAALPRRKIRESKAVRLAARYTDTLAERGSKAVLRAWQGFALHEAAICLGAMLALPVGVGKTLICYLLALVLGSRRPLLIISASLEEKTWADFGSYRGRWRLLRHPFTIKTRETLANASHADYLDRLKPDLIVIDEADDFGNYDAGAVARIDRYRVANDTSKLVMVCLTATPGRMSILDYWHLLWWCLPNSAPVPATLGEAKSWAAALDHKLGRNAWRPNPGPLGSNLRTARRWYLRRLAQTPGVVIVDGDSCTTPLVIETRIARESKRLNQAFEDFMVEQENPGGIPVTDPLSRWKFDGFLGCGIYRVWDPPPPDAWRAARRKSARFVRRMIARSRNSSRPLDTQAQVFKRYRGHPTVDEWLSIRGEYKERTRTIWITKSTVKSAIDWLRESNEPGIIWCGSVDFAERLARESGLSYYGRKGKCQQTGVGLYAAPPGKSLIASWNANKKGFNLQPWTRQLIVMPPQSAKWLEQIIGRSHRSGQTKTVTITLLMTSGGTIDAFKAAIGEAEFGRETMGITQKILRAAVTHARPNITPANEFRWATRSKERQAA